MDGSTEPAVGHTRLDDLHALLLGGAFCGMGVFLLHQAGLATGGISGVALLVSYLVPVSPGWLFLLLNIPFYFFAWRTLGSAFAIKTIIATVVLGTVATFLPAWIEVGKVDRIFAALFSGALVGMGILALARHRASVGGIGVLALFLQDRRGWRAGYVQMAFDAAILLGSLFVFDLARVALSVLSAATMNLVLALNHRPGRYTGY
ncbi:MAG: YitT family protein [Sphingomonas bacterium]|nr:YitT family protein [Sphingomonas bacterium]